MRVTSGGAAMAGKGKNQKFFSDNARFPQDCRKNRVKMTQVRD